MAAVFIWQPESLFLLSFSMTPAAKGLAISFSNTSVAILYLKKAIITVKEKWKCVYVNQARLCAHPHIVDVYDSTPWTKELYNILLLNFFSSLDFVSLHPSLSPYINICALKCTCLECRLFSILGPGKKLFTPA